MVFSSLLIIINNPPERDLSLIGGISGNVELGEIRNMLALGPDFHCLSRGFFQ